MGELRAGTTEVDPSSAGLRVVAPLPLHQARQISDAEFVALDATERERLGARLSERILMGLADGRLPDDATQLLHRFGTDPAFATGVATMLGALGVADVVACFQVGWREPAFGLSRADCLAFSNTVLTYAATMASPALATYLDSLDDAGGYGTTSSILAGRAGDGRAHAYGIIEQSLLGLPASPFDTWLALGEDDGSSAPYLQHLYATATPGAIADAILAAGLEDVDDVVGALVATNGPYRDPAPMVAEVQAQALLVLIERAHADPEVEAARHAMASMLAAFGATRGSIGKVYGPVVSTTLVAHPAYLHDLLTDGSAALQAHVAHSFAASGAEVQGAFVAAYADYLHEHVPESAGPSLAHLRATLDAAARSEQWSVSASQTAGGLAGESADGFAQAIEAEREDVEEH